jgi:hypothetical protein
MSWRGEQRSGLERANSHVLIHTLWQCKVWHVSKNYLTLYLLANWRERTYGGRATRSSVYPSFVFVVRTGMCCNSWRFYIILGNMPVRCTGVKKNFIIKIYKNLNSINMLNSWTLVGRIICVNILLPIKFRLPSPWVSFVLLVVIRC